MAERPPVARFGSFHIVCSPFVSCRFGSHCLHSFRFFSVRFVSHCLVRIFCIRCLNLFRFGSFHICIRFVSVRFTLFACDTFRVGSVRLFAFLSVLFGWVRSFHIVWFRFGSFRFALFAFVV